MRPAVASRRLSGESGAVTGGLIGTMHVPAPAEVAKSHRLRLHIIRWRVWFHSQKTPTPQRRGPRRRAVASILKFSRRNGVMKNSILVLAVLATTFSSSGCGCCRNLFAPRQSVVAAPVYALPVYSVAPVARRPVHQAAVHPAEAPARPATARATKRLAIGWLGSSLSEPPDVRRYTIHFVGIGSRSNG